MGCVIIVGLPGRERPFILCLLVMLEWQCIYFSIGILNYGVWLLAYGGLWCLVFTAIYTLLLYNCVQVPS